ncbi:hypothetical protein RGQ29_029304 [Quercus rubra]|uniref:Methyltransferase n=1 Tax=Quercus rubra TaxID=3512 RepID=A0AAN7INU8_QUERU|nr:hypothetical protein RGQ29_029304 [Quercus rubra]
MAITVPNLIKERKFPFILTLSVLLLCFAFLIFTNTKSNPYLLFTTSTTSTSTTTSALQSSLPSSPSPPRQNDGVAAAAVVINADPNSPRIDWKLCKGTVAVDFIPCLDNFKAIKALKARRHMEHRERHCPDPNPRCLVPLPAGHRIPLPWPKSRDMTLPTVEWGRHIRVILDVGCGVASFGGYLLDKNVITMSFAPKDEHEAQIQFALERGIPATLSVIGTQKLTFPDNAYDLIHCARCRVHWDADGGKPLLELNRILRPGGFFVWSATPVYRDDERDQNIWKAMVALTKSMCWKVVARTVDSSGIGLVIYQKPVSPSCYEKRKNNNYAPLCDQKDGKNSSWYVPLSHCLSLLPVDSKGNLFSWPMPWPKRLSSKPPSLSTESGAEEMFYEDTKHWSDLVSDVYLNNLTINWSSVRNVMDMNAHYGGFAAALIDLPVWVMNVIPIDVPDTLSIIFDRGLIGIYHDWCESLNTYPRTYDLLHSSFLFRNLTQRCDVLDVIVEMDRILRPGGYIVVQDNMEIINKLSPILHSLHWSLTLYKDQFLIGKKGFWRPTIGESKS